MKSTIKTQISNYYQSEVDKIQPKTDYPAQIKIQHSSGNTKWLSLNDESASVLSKWLTDNFNITQ